MSFVRSSKFRHVFVPTIKPADCFTGVKTSGNGDTNLAVSGKFFSVIKGQKIFVLPLNEPGRHEENNLPFIDCKFKVWDLAFSPFNDNVLAAGDEQGDINIYVIPEGGLKETMSKPFWSLEGEHTKKVQFLRWHPTAENILATGGGDTRIIVWNVEMEEKMYEFCFDETPFWVSWNSNGSLFSCVYQKNKKTGLRVYDPRSEEVVAEEPEAYPGVKTPKCIFLNDGKILTIGGDRQAQRAMKLWTHKGSSLSCIFEMDLGSASGVLNFFYDDTLNILFTFVKGENQIKYYEIVDDAIHFLSAALCSSSHRGGNFLPKRCVNTSSCEIARLYRLDDKKCEPNSLIVPRKSEHFQSDLYPPCASDEPAVTAEEWLGGKNAEPKMQTFDAHGSGDSNKSFKQPKKIAKQLKSDSHSGSQSTQNNHAAIPPGVDLEELVEDMKKVKATVRKLCKRVTSLEDKLKQLNADGDDDAEEEEEEE